ncbi:unnamed protein product, partial [Iphiclides podalirius]
MDAARRRDYANAPTLSWVQWLARSAIVARQTHRFRHDAHALRAADGIGRKRPRYCNIPPVDLSRVERRCVNIIREAVYHGGGAFAIAAVNLAARPTAQSADGASGMSRARARIKRCTRMSRRRISAPSPELGLLVRGIRLIYGRDELSEEARSRCWLW